MMNFEAPSMLVIKCLSVEQLNKFNWNYVYSSLFVVKNYFNGFFIVNSFVLLNRRRKGLVISAGWSGMSVSVFDWQQLEGHICVSVWLTAGGRLTECQCYTAGNEWQTKLRCSYTWRQRFVSGIKEYGNTATGLKLYLQVCLYAT